jgi:hypothetical protein
MAPMKSETLEEARDRFVELRQQEKRGAEAASEGQIQGSEPLQSAPADEPARTVPDRVEPATSDLKEGNGQGSAVAPAGATTLEARNTGRASATGGTSARAASTSKARRSKSSS